MKPSSHPESCPGCRGCGFQDGPDLWQTVGGERHRYTTVVPCTHVWQWDEPRYPDPSEDR